MESTRHPWLFALPLLMGLGVPAISSPGHVCFLIPAVPNREAGVRLTEPWGRAFLLGTACLWLTSPWRQRGKQVLLVYILTSPPLPNSCEVSCSQDSVGFFCPSTPPCQNGGVFQASRGSCSCPPGWMVCRAGPVGMNSVGGSL